MLQFSIMKQAAAPVIDFLFFLFEVDLVGDERRAETAL